MNDLLLKIYMEALGAKEVPKDVETHIPKFAELIVKECARVSETYARGYANNSTAELIGFAVKRHFGYKNDVS